MIDDLLVLSSANKSNFDKLLIFPIDRESKREVEKRYRREEWGLETAHKSMGASATHHIDRQDVTH